MASFIETLFAKSKPAPLAELEKLRARENEIRQQFAAINAGIRTLENEAEEARRLYFETLTWEAFERFLTLTIRVREARLLFSANHSALQAKVDSITETPAIRETLQQACKVTQKAILELAGSHEADDKTRCIEAGVTFLSSPTATDLRRRAARIDDVLVHLANESQPAWRHESVLRSL